MIKTTCVFMVLSVLVHIQPSLAAPGGKDTLSVTIRSIQRGATDSIRFSANRFLTDTFYKMISVDTSFQANFSSFSNISTITDPEKQIRICTWVVPNYNGDHYSYFGFLQIRDLKKKSFTTIKLIDSTEKIVKPESEKLKPERWLGAVYYSIIPMKEKTTVSFTLLGWKGKNTSTSQKVIETMLVEKGNVRFGIPILKTGSVFKNRVLYTFSSQASMMLKYEVNSKRIMVDHLTSKKTEEGSSPLLSGPDGTYDAFNLVKNKWILQSDVDVTKDQKLQKSKTPLLKDDQLEKSEEKK